MAQFVTSGTRNFVLTEAGRFDLELPEFAGMRSDYIVYTVVDANTDQLVGYLVKGTHVKGFDGSKAVYWRTGVVGSRQLTAGVKSRAAALKARFAR